MEPCCKHLQFAITALSVVGWLALMLAFYLPLGSLTLAFLGLSALYTRYLDFTSARRHADSSGTTGDEIAV